MDEGTPCGAGGGESSSPQFSGRQTGVARSFSQIMGFLDLGRDAARKSQALLPPALGCFSEVQLGSGLEGRKGTSKNPWKTRRPTAPRGSRRRGCRLIDGEGGQGPLILRPAVFLSSLNFHSFTRKTQLSFWAYSPTLRYMFSVS